MPTLHVQLFDGPIDIFLGDHCDRGADSLAVIRFVRQLIERVSWWLEYTESHLATIT